ncbi:MAG: hypothetical protein B7Z80_09370 [Rhodospirillales bacterium 20-64-7]|nr:MAG: hypothetical protein B7Z80_09370 [Rhodospirillales bacterium 20-64-7]
MLAQAALETGWGSSVPGNNLFGIKAADGQPGISSTTHELVDGVLTRQTADFRSYADLGSAISDYVGLIRSGFAGAAGQASVAGFAQALQNSGYATDPAYAAKLTAIADSPLMRQALQVVATPAADADANATPNPNPTEAGTR